MGYSALRQWENFWSETQGGLLIKVVWKRGYTNCIYTVSSVVLMNTY